MKILHIVSSYWPAFEFGGPIASVYFLNEWLAKKEIEITVYTTNAGLQKNKDIFLKKSVNLDGVKVFYFPYLGYKHYNFSPSLFLALAKNIKKFDLIHITGIWNFPVAAAAFWARFYKKPYLVSPRGSLMKEPLTKKSSFKKKIYLSLIANRDLKNASAIHFTTAAEKEEYLKIGLPLKKAIVVPNGLDFQSCEKEIRKIDFRKKFGIPADKKIVLFLSRLNWKKGLDTLIPAFAEVVKKKPRAILVLAGSDEKNYKIQIEKLVKDYDLGKNVLFVGMLLGEDKTTAYRESAVFVLPSYSENFGMAVAEAMSFGVPVIITKTVGIAPSVEKAGAGLVVEKDKKQLSEAILRILNNPELAKKMGAAGKQLVATEFSWPEIAEKWVQEYNTIINNE